MVKFPSLIKLEPTKLGKVIVEKNEPLITKEPSTYSYHMFIKNPNEEIVKGIESKSNESLTSKKNFVNFR